MAEKGTIAVIMAILALVGTGSGIVATFSQVSEINDKMNLMTAQVEDTQHENLMTRINNALTILENCDIPEEKKQYISSTLNDALKETTLKKDFNNAEKKLSIIIEDLMACDIPIFGLMMPLQTSMVNPLPRFLIPNASDSGVLSDMFTVSDQYLRVGDELYTIAIGHNFSDPLGGKVFNIGENYQLTITQRDSYSPEEQLELTKSILDIFQEKYDFVDNLNITDEEKEDRKKSLEHLIEKYEKMIRELETK